MVRKALREVEGVVYLWDAELVEGRFRVDAGAGIPVPVPDAAKVGCYQCESIVISKLMNFDFDVEIFRR